MQYTILFAGEFASCGNILKMANLSDKSFGGTMRLSALTFFVILSGCVTVESVNQLKAVSTSQLCRVQHSPIRSEDEKAVIRSEIAIRNATDECPGHVREFQAKVQTVVGIGVIAALVATGRNTPSTSAYVYDPNLAGTPRYGSVRQDAAGYQYACDSITRAPMIWIAPYLHTNGTMVRGHWRTVADGDPSNNLRCR